MKQSDEYINSLVEKIKAGDKISFEKLFNLYYNSLANLVYRYIGDKSVAEDLVQEVFLDIWLKRKSWQPENLNSWLYRAVRNKAVDFIRHEQVKKAQAPNIVDTYAKKNQEELLEEKQLKEQLNNAITQLPERCRNTFILHRQQGYSYAEIADIMGVSIKTVETQMARALKILSDKLDDYLPIIIFITTGFNLVGA